MFFEKIKNATSFDEVKKIISEKEKSDIIEKELDELEIFFMDFSGRAKSIAKNNLSSLIGLKTKKEKLMKVIELMFLEAEKEKKEELEKRKKQEEQV